MSTSQITPRYIAYIDEAGDDGLTTVRPIDPKGSSEWLIMGAVVIDVSRIAEAGQWVTGILGSLEHYKLPHLHFNNTNIKDGRHVCEIMADLPIRCFVVASNKKNMKGYFNPFAASIPANNWFYCWLTRLLLERVTYFALQKSIADHGRPHPLRIEFSERGRFHYGQLFEYYDWLQTQSEGGKNALPLGDLSWEVMNRQHFRVRRNENRPGLQLADVVASAFYRACDLHSLSECDPECAKLLEPRMARNPDSATGDLHGFGVKLMPKWGVARLATKQQEIFRFYGYPKPQWWMPPREVR